MSVTLNREIMYVQLPEFFYAHEDKWYCWHQTPHDHSVYEMHILLKGSAQIRVEKELYYLEPGSAMIIAPGKFHEPMALEGEFQRFSFLFIPDEKSPNTTATLQNRIPVCRIFSSNAQMRELAYQILQDWTAAEDYRKEMRQALFKALMIHTFRMLGLNSRPVSMMDGERPRMIICDGYFAGDTPDKSTEQLARYLGISERQLHRCLMDYYGMSFQQKLTHTRMEKAAWYLRTTDRHVNVIATDVGYDSESGFFKVFRKYYGMTPLQYRKKYRNGQGQVEQGHKL